MTLLGVGLGALATFVAIAVAGPWLQARFGIGLSLSSLTTEQWLLLAAVLVAGFIASLVPGWRAYRMSLADGLSPRLSTSIRPLFIVIGAAAISVLLALVMPVPKTWIDFSRNGSSAASSEKNSNLPYRDTTWKELIRKGSGSDQAVQRRPDEAEQQQPARDGTAGRDARDLGQGAYRQHDGRGCGPLARLRGPALNRPKPA